MGVGRRATIAEQLLDGGLPGDTPVAAVHSVSTADEVVMRCRLDQLGAVALASPAVIVIGQVADVGRRLRPVGPTRPTAAHTAAQAAAGTSSAEIVALRLE